MTAAALHPILRRCHCAAPVPVPLGARGRWLLVRSDRLGEPARIAAFLQPLDQDGRPVGDPVPMRDRGRRRGRDAVLFASDTVTSLGFAVVGRPRATTAIDVRLAFQVLSGVGAAVRLFAADRAAVLILLRSLATSRLRGARALLQRAEAALISPPPRHRSYEHWLSLFESWGADELPDRADDPPLRFLVFHQAAIGPALDATVASLEAQSRGPVRFRFVGPLGDPVAEAAALIRTQASGGGGRFYVGVLQAGEVLPPHAVAVARAALRDAGQPPIAIGDGDRIVQAGRRAEPVFRPRPGRALLLSGTLTRGVLLVRDDVLERALPGLAESGATAGWAEPFRLSLALGAIADERTAALRVPHVLCSRRIDTETAPAGVLAAVASRHLRRSGLPFRATPTFPVRLEPSGQITRRHSITALVPSTLTAAHAERCIGAVLERTDHPRFNLLVAVTAPELPASAAAVARRLEASHPNLRVLHCPAPLFNFSWAINRAAEAAEGDLLLLLNDDIAPFAPDWLDRMAGWFADPDVGAVGARLLYPDGTIQHAGVVLGLAGLCEHAHRGWPGEAPGHDGRAQLPQDLLAVTGACLLLPATLFRAIGGMDESFPSAFNDVDLCLRIGERGRAVILSDATLVHEESKTYGSHWTGERAAHEADDIARLRRRWPDAVADDPFYNPNLDLRLDRAWQPAWPPRRADRTPTGRAELPADSGLRAADRLDDVAWPSADGDARLGLPGVLVA